MTMTEKYELCYRHYLKSCAMIGEVTNVTLDTYMETVPESQIYEMIKNGMVGSSELSDTERCEGFGNPDGMDGSCVDCSIENRAFWQKCMKESRMKRPVFHEHTTEFLNQKPSCPLCDAGIPVREIEITKVSNDTALITDKSTKDEMICVECGCSIDWQETIEELSYIFKRADMHGVESLTDDQQAVYNGKKCHVCYMLG